MIMGPGIVRTALPAGFRAGGINSGVRKYRPDLGLIVSDRDAVGAGVFTLSECKAAPIQYSQQLLPSGKIRAIVTNSGQANAATGLAGVETNKKMAEIVAQSLGCRAEQVLTASTGVIGVPLEIEKIADAAPVLVDRLSGDAESFALAILTTDLLPKTVTTTIALSTGSVRITGICKGSGMIHPNMGTMLGYLLTDAVLSETQAQVFLQESTDLSFNMISVDGDTSTNDCVFLLANGASQVKVEIDEDVRKFKDTLIEISKLLAQSIARDGEGATKLIEVSIVGSSSLEVARRAARGVTLSPLVKSAIHGEDPNWGRVLARLGAERVPQECLNRMSLEIQGTRVFESGQPILFDRAAIRLALKKDTVQIKIDLKSGKFEATAWGCDLSKKYVEINTEYST